MVVCGGGGSTSSVTKCWQIGPVGHLMLHTTVYTEGEVQLMQDFGSDDDRVSGDQAAVR